MKEKEIRGQDVFDRNFWTHAYRIAIISIVTVVWTLIPSRVAPADQAIAATKNSSRTPAVSSNAVPMRLSERKLLLPVRGMNHSDLYDSFHDERGKGRKHRAIDILADLHTPVLAIEDGTVARLENSALGGISIYQFDPTGRYVYYYAHLHSYARGLAEGQVIRQGDIIGYVGETGNAQTPHLHFAISRLGPDRKWWRGEPLNPYPLLLNALAW